MAFGMLTITAAFVVMRIASGPSPVRAGPSTSSDTLLFILAAWAPLSLLGAFVLRAILTSGARREHDIVANPPVEPAALVGQFSAITLACAALIESCGIFGALTFYLTGHPLALAAVGLAMAAMTAFFPTRGRFDAFIRDVTGRPYG